MPAAPMKSATELGSSKPPTLPPRSAGAGEVHAALSSPTPPLRETSDDAAPPTALHLNLEDDDDTHRWFAFGGPLGGPAKQTPKPSKSGGAGEVRGQCAAVQSLRVSAGALRLS